MCESQTSTSVVQGILPSAADYFRSQMMTWQDMLSDPDRLKSDGLHGLVIDHLESLKLSADGVEVIELAFAVCGFGLVLQRSDSHYAILLPDASQPGKFRYQSFDSRGFFAHTTRDTMSQVILEAYKEGFRKVADDQLILDKLSVTDEWAQGMTHAAKVMRHNMGLKE
jgi:hypothetical protein